MPIRGYILINAEDGSARKVGQALAVFDHPDARVIDV